jgi:hypothetical protein
MVCKSVLDGKGIGMSKMRIRGGVMALDKAGAAE